MNARRSKAVRNGKTLYVALPPDWVRGNGLKAGDRVNVEYDGFVRVKVLAEDAISAAERSNFGGRVRRPAQPAQTDNGVLADAGG